MSEKKISKVLSNEEFIKELSNLCGFNVDKDQIAMCFYSIMLDEEDNSENFIDGKIIVDNSVYKQNIHGNLLNLAKRYMRNPEAFQFDSSFIDMIYDRGI